MKNILLVFLMPSLYAEVPQFLKKHCLYADGKRVQLRSVSQSGASCAYHALRNGLETAKALEGQSLGNLYSCEHAAVTENKWRQVIVKHRADKLARDHIRDILLWNLRSDKRLVKSDKRPKNAYNLRIDGEHSLVLEHQRSNELDDLVHNQICPIIESLVKLYGRQTDKGYAYKITDGQIREAFKGTPYVCYFDDVTIDLTVHKSMKVSGSYTDKKRDSIASYGDWLLGEEIPLLIAQENPRCMVTTFNDYSGDCQEEVMLVTEDFQMLVDKMKDSNQDVTAVIVTYIKDGVSGVRQWLSLPYKDMWSTLTTDRTNGHYVSVVVHRLDGQVTYYLADSLGNGNLTQNNTIESLIARLEGRKPIFRTPKKDGYFKNMSTLTKIGVAGVVTGTLYLLYRWWKR